MKRIVTVALVAVVLISGLVGVLSRDGGNPADDPIADRGTRAAPHLPQVRIEDLPPQARRTLNLIEQGGPFPYRQDGTVFQNRERLLPIRPRGTYREYTVPTPGTRDRGARRIVSDTTHAHTYYTSDHYRSFKVVVP